MSHAVYDTRYHLVWAPKYRKWLLKKKVRDAVKELFEEILAARDCEIEKMEIAEDHVRIFTSTPPRYSVGGMVRVLKSVSAKEIFLRYPEVKKELRGGGSGGLGLASVKTMVDTYSGTIQVESKRERGTTFIVKIPVEQHMFKN